MIEKTKLIGLDCGDKQTGIAIITNGRIEKGMNLMNEELIPFIICQKKECDKIILVIEDVRPYNMRITNGIINTIKFLGQIEWRLSELGIKFILIPRWEIKQWVFLQYRLMAEPEIIKKIEYSNKRNEAQGKPNGRKQTPSFVYVDDRLVQKAMRIRWKIEKPKRVGEKAMYGLKDHSWQALGLISYYIVSYKPHEFLNLSTA